MLGGACTPPNTNKSQTHHLVLYALEVGDLFDLVKYDSLSEKEHSTMKKILKKSKVVKTFPNHKNNGHNKKHGPF